MNQENQLNSYGWVDQKAGVAHIPIERAMELLVQRGIPVRSSVSTPASGDGSTTAATTAQEQNKKSDEKGKSSAQ
jgi:hypothetical protein